LMFQHELTHYFTWRTLGAIPVWLNEGLADYHSTLVVDQGFAYFGAPRPDRGFAETVELERAEYRGSYRTMAEIRSVPSVAWLLGSSPRTFRPASPNRRASRSDHRTQRFAYYGAYALVHLLKHSPAYRERFRDFLSEIRRGQRAPVAWSRCFGDVDPRAL